MLELLDFSPCAVPEFSFLFNCTRSHGFPVQNILKNPKQSTKHVAGTKTCNEAIDPNASGFFCLPLLSPNPDKTKECALDSDAFLGDGNASLRSRAAGPDGPDFSLKLNSSILIGVSLLETVTQ